MDFSDPVKSKKIFILMLVLTIMFFVGAGVLGYFYYEKFKAYKSLASDKQKLEDQLRNSSTTWQKKNNDLEKDKAQLQKDKKTLQDQIAADRAKIDKAKAYLETLVYVNQLIADHGGLVGWTEAEFQEGRRIAETTGDSSYVDLVDWCWNRRDINQITRLTRFYKASTDGISSNLP